ncbi:cell wall-binding repeat-containing protein [Agromyces silvae]|uniref:cell wall-binding repeat-containing protein n=1 Tax=Agromyces silvae TaxID=3388266 RepID=UPI00280A961E|nr:cell wall-binding repeat-containing protein [Agromyces protaetiae]
MTQATADASGAYQLQGVGPGTYVVHVYGPSGTEYLGEYWPDAPNVTVAGRIVLADREIRTGVDLQLAFGGIVRGVVRDDLGVPVSGASIAMERTDVSNGGIVWRGVADVNGAYEVRRLETGVYRTSARSSSHHTTYLSRVKAAGDTVVDGLDLQLIRYSSISGRATDEAGAPLRGITVRVYRLDEADWRPVALATTDTLGEFTIPYLVAGVYKARFGEVNDRGNFLQQWWHGADVESARPIDIRPGEAYSGVVTQMVDGATIGGVITNESGEVARNQPVTLYERTADALVPVAGASTDRDGAYRFGRVAPGTYSVQFRSSATLVGEWWDDRPDGESAIPIDVVAGETRSGIDAELGVGATVDLTVDASLGAATVGSTLTAAAWSATPGATFSYIWFVDGELQLRASSSSFPLAASHFGKTISVLVSASAPGHHPNSIRSAPTEPVGRGLVRVAGVDRFETSVEVSKWRHPGRVAVAYVANGTKFPDALAGGPLAGRQGGPVLLTLQDRLPEVAAEELERLGPRRIVVLGDSASVSDDVVAELRTLTEGSVTRLAGADRFATSVAISKSYFKPDATAVIITNGTKFPDALSSTRLASGFGAPILLTTADDIPDVVREELERLQPRRIFVLGDTTTVNSRIEAELSEYTDGAVTRVAGTDRFETSAAISRTAGPGDSVVFLVNGTKFPDALSAAAPAASNFSGGPMLLTLQDALPTVIERELRRLKPAQIVIVGDTSSVSAEVEAMLAAL